MFLDGLCIDKDIIEIYTDNAFVDQISENVVHHHLECGGTVSEPKKHYQGFIEAPIHAEGSLPLVTFFDADIVVTPSNIKFREISGIVQLIDQFRDQGNRVAIFHGNSIEGTIVLDKSE